MGGGGVTIIVKSSFRNFSDSKEAMVLCSKLGSCRRTTEPDSRDPEVIPETGTTETVVDQGNGSKCCGSMQ